MRIEYALIAMIAGGLIAFFGGVYGLHVDSELARLGLADSGSGSTYLVWLSVSVMSSATILLEVFHQRKCRKWRRDNPGV